VADVIATDPAKQTITLKARNAPSTEDRRPRAVQARHQGDQVEATFTEAVAIAVTPAKKDAAPAAKDEKKKPKGGC